MLSGEGLFRTLLKFLMLGLCRFISIDLFAALRESEGLLVEF